MTLMRCPVCRREITGDDPDGVPTNEDGTVDDEFPCLDCICAELDGYPDDAA